jgi:hypothetical protein
MWMGAMALVFVRRSQHFDVASTRLGSVSLYCDDAKLSRLKYRNRGNPHDSIVAYGNWGTKATSPKNRMLSWSNACSPQATFTMPTAWFGELGLHDLASVATGVLPKTT